MTGDPDPLEGFVTPEQFLTRSMEASDAGDHGEARAYALQGILQLQIVQHYQALELMRRADRSREAAVEEPEKVSNPLGECAAGHAFLAAGCADCAADLIGFEPDTVETEGKEDRDAQRH